MASKKKTTKNTTSKTTNLKDYSAISKFITPGKEKEAEKIAGSYGGTLKAPSGVSKTTTPKTTQTDASFLKNFITPGGEAKAEEIAGTYGKSIYGKNTPTTLENFQKANPYLTPNWQDKAIMDGGEPGVVPGTAIGDEEVQRLAAQGYTEGMNVPGKGILTPEGTFAPASAGTDMTAAYKAAGAMQPPPGVDVTDAAGAKAAVATAVTGAQGTPAPTGGTELMELFDTDQNKDLLNIEKMYRDFYTPENQKNSLMETYREMVSDLGIDDINEELIDAKRIIEGTEDDIRTEVTKAGGFATESQVQAMTNARNKSLIKNYNVLLETKNALTDQLDSMMQYAQADRQYAAQQFESRMNFEMKKIEYGQQAQRYAGEQLNNIVNRVGYAGLLSMTNNDPYTISKVEKALGLGTGGLVQLAGIAEPGDLQFVSGTDNQPMGYFDKKTGKFTQLGRGPGSNIPNVSGLTPEQQADPFILKMLATKGGKPLTDTFAQQLNKGLTVLSQIGTLQTNIQDTNTGPIAGAFRGANPWDTNAQTIKAQLNAIVPNLARGVYGEVGVLTDADVANYSKTLPNLKSPEDIRNAVLGITVDLIGKSIKRNLEINAANGKDVSGFVDIYTEMQNTKESIFSQIPGYKGNTGEQVDLTPEDNAAADAVLGSAGSTSTTGSGGNWWKTFTSWLGY